MSKLSRLAKDLRRSSKLTNRQALMLKGGDDKRMGGSLSGGGISSPGSVINSVVRDVLPKDETP